MKDPKRMDPLEILSLEWEPIGIEHATAAYWGEGGYEWSCSCGAAESDFSDEDSAVIAATYHLINEDAARPVSIEEAYA